MTALVLDGTDTYICAGLFGYAQGGSIKNTGVTGNVYISNSSYVYAGGLVGESFSNISNSYSTCNVYASSPPHHCCAGGLAGYSHDSDDDSVSVGISNSHATGNIYAYSSSSDYSHAGGLVGYSYGSGGISKSYAIGNVSIPFTSSYVGRLAGSLGGSITNSYYYSGTTVEGTKISSYGEGLTPSQMTGQGEGRATDKMKGFKDSNNWIFQDDSGRAKYLPRLKSITYGKGNPAPKFIAPAANDFVFKPPAESIIYDGESKEANVTVKPGIEGVGKINVKYYDSTGAQLENPPTNAGEYTVKIDVEKGKIFSEFENITAGDWKFTIKQALPENPVTPTLDSVEYGTKLSEITLDDGWNWVDDTITTTVENQGYVAYYNVEEDPNYNWSEIEGYNPELHRVERTLNFTVFVDKSGWGEEVKNNGEINYVDENGTTSAEVVKKDVTWVKEESDGTYAWYGVDNSEGEFELGSRFWVRWLNKEKDKAEWEYYYNNLDEKHKNAVDSDRLWIFLAGVTAPNGQDYKEFNKDVKFYIQLGEDWDKEDINAVFINSGKDEIVGASYADNMSCPEGEKEFAILNLKHFSPYAVYDKNRNETTSDEDSDNITDKVWSLFTTGDTATPLILTGLAVLVIASGITMIILKKKRKK